MRSDKLANASTHALRPEDIGVVATAQESKKGWIPLGNGYKREIKMLDQ